MALNFNSEQIKSISDEYLSISTEIATAEQNKLAAIAEKDQHKKNDEKNLVFYNNYKNIITQYHRELEYILGIKKVNYSDDNLIPAAKSLPTSLHYPLNPLWVNLIPKIIDSNNGLPTTQNSLFEKVDNSSAQYHINLLKSGFASGAVTTSGVSGVTGNDVILASSSIAVGDMIICNGSGSSFIGKVNAKVAAGPDTKYTFDFLYPSTVVNWSGSVAAKNFFSGFTNTERESFVSSDYQMVLASITQNISSYVDACISWLSNQLDAVSRNDADGPEKKEISDAKSNINRSLSLYQSWKASPNTGSGVGKWGDTKINPVLSDLVVRVKDIGVRLGQITNRLGSVAQQSNGVFSGSGNYLNFFKWLDFRINKGQGTLSLYYASDLGLLYFDQKILSLQRKETELKQKFVIELFAENPVGDSVKMKNVKGFVVGDILSLAAKDLDLIKSKIVSIGADNVIKFDSIIPESFNVDAGARAIKQL
jgi:hypothetical protein